MAVQHLEAGLQNFLPDRTELKYFSKCYCEDSDHFEGYMSNFSGARGENNYAYVGEKSISYFWTNDESATYCKQSASFNRNIPRSVRQMLGGI